MRWLDGWIKFVLNCEKIVIVYIYIYIFKINVYLFWDGFYKLLDNWLNGLKIKCFLYIF